MNEKKEFTVKKEWKEKTKKKMHFISAFKIYLWYTTTTY